MKLIVAGGRDFCKTGPNEWNYEPHLVQLAIDHYDIKDIDVIVCGMATGADRLGEIWAKQTGVEVEYFPADWNAYGNRAGILRNTEMAKAGDALLAFWDQKSRGTQHMINEMKKLGKPVYVIYYQ